MTGPYQFAQDKDKIISYYESCLENHQDEVKMVGWRSRNRQDLRFKVLAQIGDLDGTSVLDLGCGLGALGEFLQREGVEVDYRGYEICGRTVRMARKLRPYLRMEEVDILEGAAAERFDWVLASGIFNLRLQDNDSFLERILSRAYDICRLGVGVNMLGTYVDYQDERLYYTDPARAFALAKRLTKRVVLRYDYMPYEFTLYLYKTDFTKDAF